MLGLGSDGADKKLHAVDPTLRARGQERPAGTLHQWLGPDASIHQPVATFVVG